MGNIQPTVGAALGAENLAQHADWILTDQRDLEIQNPSWPMFFESDWQASAREVRTVLDGYTGRIGIHGPFISIVTGAIDTKIRAAVQERFKQALDYAAEIGGTHMVIHSPFDYLGKPYIPPTIDGELGFFESMTFAATHETLRPIIEQAASIGCTLVIENIYDPTPVPLLKLIKSLDSEYVRMSLDTGHAYVNATHNGAPPPDLWVRAAGELLGHIHLQDTDGYNDRHWVPGDGLTCWAPFFRELSQLKHAPRLILELNEKHRIEEAAQFFADHGWAK